MEYRSLEHMLLDVAEMIRPPERLTVSQAAEKYRYLKNEGSYVGPWRNATAPYLVEPMDTLTSLDFTGEVFVGPARCGKSDPFFNWLAHTAICDPADMMLIHMTNNTARDWSQVDLAKALRHSKAMGEKLLPGRQNDNVHDKHFRSGMNLLVKWPAISELSARRSRGCG
jgi:phage terminase large subunit GpA-like protein